MLTANFLKTLYNELISFFKDAKNFIINIISSIYNFLNRYMSEEVIILFSIAIGAFILILIFRAVINHDK